MQMKIDRRQGLRRTSGLLVIIGLALGAPGGAVAAAARPAATPGTPAAAPHAQLSPVQSALKRAKADGKPVPVSTLTTPTDETFAQPNGSLSRTSYLKPVRVHKGGSWTALDATLGPNADGTYSPRATPSGVTLSGGGTGPLARLVNGDGRHLNLSFPVALPRPQVTKNTALYRDVFPGVDLQTSVSEQGAFSEVLIVRSAEAAANPAIQNLRLATETQGLTVGKDSAGNLTATAPDGALVYTSATPLMWDSKTPSAAPAGSTEKSAASRSAAAGQAGASTSAPATPAAGHQSSAESPGAGAQVATVGLTTTHEALTLTPDLGLLTGPNTTYPVYIDPVVNPVSSQTGHYAQTMEGCPNSSTYDSPQDWGEGVGYQQYTANCFGMEESYFEINTSALSPEMVISSSTLYLTETYGADHGCSNEWPVTLKWTHGISSSTTWRTRPAPISNLGTRSVSSASPVSSCGYKNLNFDVVGQIRQVAAAGDDTWTFGLFGDSRKTTANLGFMRFSTNPYLVTVFDIPPHAPDLVTTTPESANPNTSACLDGTPGWIGATSTTDGKSNISLNARLTSPMQGVNLQGIYTVWDNMKNNGSGGAATVSSPRSSWVASGTVARTNIGIAVTDGHKYGWGVKATDGTLEGPWTSDCNFMVDLTPPTPVAFGDSAAYPPIASGRKPTAHAGDTGITIPVTSKDTIPTGCELNPCLRSGIRRIEYSLDTPVPPVGAQSIAVTPDANGSVTANVPINLTAQQWGSHTLYVQAVDGANNARPSSYSFYAPWNPTAQVAAGDVTGDGLQDMLRPDPSGNLLLIPGNSDPASTPATASTPDSSPDGTSWENYLVTHRGSLSQSGVDDIFTYNKTTRQLYVYRNDAAHNGTPGHFSLTQGVMSITTKPACNPAATCTGYVTNWSKVTQLLAPGSFDNTLGLPDLITIEDGRLWYYPGASSGNTRLGQGMLLGSGDWSNTTLVAPGKVGGTPTLWARDDASGRLYSYPLQFNAGGIPTKDLLPPKAQSAAAAIATVDPVAYPYVGSHGDVNGDHAADLWAVSADQQLMAFVGNAAGTGFAPTPVSVGNLNKPTAQWKLASQSNNITPSAVGNYPATTAGVSFLNESIGGRHTPYASFSGPGSTITTTSTVIDTRSSFTISTWAKATEAGSVVLSQDGTRFSSVLLYPDPYQSSWRFALANRESNDWPFDMTTHNSSAAPVVLNAWTRLTAVYDAGTGRMSLYVNGVLAGSGHHKAADSPTPTGPLTLGRFRANGALNSSGFKGGISNLAVYPYAAPVTAPSSTSAIILAAAANNCADNDWNLAVNGNKIQIAGCNGTEAQKFQIHKDGTIRIQAKCLDATNAGTTNGTLIMLMTCNEGGNQQFIPRADGSIHNPVSGRCIDLGDFDTTPGRQLWLYDCNGSDAQRWTIPALSTAPLPTPNP
ncbi:ricin-type beta-trefoil lectin domain protein [Streptomyces sp. NPDC058525]|uniref:ricin-type beta-trefoil lectin domain protein n=1 Tax=Streptomyces sp. NPDC058525 TaxID=3346538 RepID=UPI00364925FE